MNDDVAFVSAATQQRTESYVGTCGDVAGPITLKPIVCVCVCVCASTSTAPYSGQKPTMNEPLEKLLLRTEHAARLKHENNLGLIFQNAT